jgi:hypothetical protein
MSKAIVRLLAIAIVNIQHQRSKAQSPNSPPLGLSRHLFSKKQVQREETERRSGVRTGWRKSQKQMSMQRTRDAQIGPRSTFLEISENGTPGMRKRDGITKRSVRVRRKDEGRRNSTAMRSTKNRRPERIMSPNPLGIRRDGVKRGMATYLPHP